MTMYSSRKLPTWASVLATWSEANVPDVREIPFKSGEYFPSLPWFDLKVGRQSEVSENPVLTTAYHLLKVIPSDNEELKAAYKLEAYCRTMDDLEFSAFVLRPVFEKYGHRKGELWHSNAKQVLPWNEQRLSRYELQEKFKSQRGDWSVLVQEAAKEWIGIAERWAVIRIPEWMEIGSEELSDYERHHSASTEAHEREQYERLKQKFG